MHCAAPGRPRRSWPAFRPALVQCFYGAEDGESGCLLPELKGAELIRTAGGHHFDGGYEALADAIMAPAAGP